MLVKMNSLENLIDPGVFLLPLVLKHNRRPCYRMPQNYKIVSYSYVFVRKWLTKKEKTLKKLRDKFRTLNERNFPIANRTSLFVVVRGHIRKRKSDGLIDFTQHVNIQRLLGEQGD